MKNISEIQDEILPERKQPKFTQNKEEIVIAISSLALGGAEMIVTDWLSRMSVKYKTHLIVLRNKEEEWNVPSFVKVTRIENLKQVKNVGNHINRIIHLQKIGKKYSDKGGTNITCHLLNQEERLALKGKNNFIISVLHNAKVGWNEAPTKMTDVDFFVCVSDACAKDLKKSGIDKPFVVIKHLPKTPFFLSDTKLVIKKFLKIPKKSKVIGMIGSFKVQKNYLFAIKVFEKILLKNKDAYLVILGGTSNKDSEEEMRKVVSYINSKPRLQKRIRIPGSVQKASSWLVSFDVFLNTSYFEGLSIATLEAMSLGLPCVLSKVGGQGEILTKNTTLLTLKQTVSVWASVVIKNLNNKVEKPSWNNFPSYNLWTILSRIKKFRKPNKNKVLFITSNLNLGGAQRSLVNLLEQFKDKDIKLLVAGNSTSNYFYKKLLKVNIPVARSFTGFDSYQSAFNIITEVYKSSFNRIVFWNVDPKLKFLLVKFLNHEKSIKIVDVSPGHDSYNDIEKIKDFSTYISFSSKEYYKNLHSLVSKFSDKKKSLLKNYVYIPNGVSDSFTKKKNYNLTGNFKIVVSGRLVESKFVIEIIDSFNLVLKKHPKTELHFYGSVTEHSEYSIKIKEKVSQYALEDKIYFHGKDFNVADKLHMYDLYVVLGIHQGSPNALLEAMAVGMPCISNDSGGCREIIQNNKNGILLKKINTVTLANTIKELIVNHTTRVKFGTEASKVTAKFSLKRMARDYKKLLSI